MVPGLISVIIPVYNTAPYLRRCLTSVLNNTYKQLEVLCIDDGSTDSSPEILQSLAGEDPRITILEQKNSGVSIARNHGLEHASGEFIAFVDSDDWVHPQYFEILMECQRACNADIALCGYRREAKEQSFDTITPVQIQPRRAALHEIFDNHGAKSYVWMRLYRSSLIAQLRFPVNVAYEDVLFNANLFCTHSGLTFACTPLPLYYYFVRSDSLSVQVSTPSNILHMAEVFAKVSDTAANPENKALMLTESIKLALSARYTYRVTEREDKTAAVEVDQQLRSYLSQLIRLDTVSTGNKIKYAILCHSPHTYRLLRIAKDPSLLRWEKDVRKKAALELKL